MPDLPKYTLEAIQKLSRARLGLILGPTASTTNGTFWAGLRDELATKFGVDPAPTYHEVGELAVEKGSDVKLVREAVIAFASRQPASPIVTTLAGLRWTAVISGCLDDNFETRLQQVHDRRAARIADIAVISDLAAAVPGNTVPVFKLLGSSQHQNPVATTAELFRRTSLFHGIAREFLDFVKAAPILCAGFDGAQWLLDHLLGALYANRGRHPANLIFLLTDPVTQSARLTQLVPRSSTFLADGTLVEVARALEPRTHNRQTSFEFTTTTGKQVSADLSEFSDLFCVVNTRIEPDIAAHERERLLDYLFMPDVPNWNPIAHELDLPRTVLGSLQELIIDHANSENRSAVFLLQGRAASGKTSVLKRLAFNLAQQGMLVCWLLDYWFSDMARQLESALKKIREASTEPVALFIDNPSLLRDLDLTSLLGVAERLNVTLLLVVGARSSDASHVARNVEDGAGRVAFHRVDLPDVLDSAEWQILPEYLLKLGIHRTPEEATAAVNAAATSRQTRDSLALLYYLLPKTRQAIEGSIRSEYVSLGDSRSLKKIVAGAFSGAHPHLQNAYAMVAAATRYGVFVPAEVLVNALGVSYGEWVDSINRDGPAWGFLYPDDSEDIEGARYRTRNDVVTNIVLELINGSASSRSGEVEKLRLLLAACDSSNPVYEKFCERLLIRNSNLSGLDLAQGLKLFEAAERALPHPSRALIHHKGIWIRKNRGDLDLALKTFDAALAAPASPHAEREELDEFIHTSKAAAIVDKMDGGLLDWDEGQNEALRELERSRSPNFINANAVHLYATLVERMAFRKAAPPEVDQYELVNRALADIDRTLIVVRTGGRLGLRADVDMLEERRMTLLARIGDVDSGAERVWEDHQNQLGFVVATRRRLAKALARRPNAGPEFKDAFDYWNAARERVTARAPLAPELAEVGLVLYYTWQVEPRSQEFKRNPRNPVNWTLMKECADIVLRSPRFQKDPFYRYLYALSLAQTGDWVSARVVFQENRKLGLPNDTLHMPRSYYLHNEGNPWHLQGHLKPGANSDYFNAVDIHQDFEVARGERWPRNPGIQFAYVTFSFAGPRATRSETACRRS